MNTRKSLLMLALGTAAAALSFGTLAQVVNPDNDSATFFKYVAPQVTAARVAGALPKSGEVTADGLYVYTGSDRGWEHRGHGFEVAAGRVAHMADCLAYDAPKPIVSGVPAMERGIFGDHAA